MANFDEKYFLETFEKLIKIDSTTGCYEEIQAHICKTLEDMGVKYHTLRKGGVIAELGGKEPALAVTAHFDAIGLMVRHINADGTLCVCPVGGLYPVYCVTENVRIHTRAGKVFTGCICRTPNSVHVTEDELRKEVGDFDKNVCVVLDEDVKSADDVRKLGIETGDDVALEPRFTLANGYIKSRFIDDKAAVAILLTTIKAIKDNNTNRKLYFYFAAYEEIGHGTTWLPDDVKDILAVDIAPTGEKQTSDERKVSIFCKDSRIPYHWAMTNELKAAAEKANIPFVMDIFTPHYGTDCEGSISAGYDIRFAAIGFGTANSHGYERTQLDGIKATYDLLNAYISV
ncbi:MAG: M42 family metallopeptidase [Clostridia bacterium]|nr:M42 family metallopeptidase [Clostridia bacterium]